MRRIAIAVAATIALAAAPPAAAKWLSGFSGPAVSYEGSVTGSPGGPASDVRFAAVPGRRETTIVTTDVDGGEIRETGRVDGVWGLPAVTLDGEPGGLSANGETLVLVRPPHPSRPDASEFLILDADHFRVRDRVELNKLASFDAISPDGRLVYFVLYDSPGNPFDYAVRAYDRKRGELLPGEIVDPEEPDEQMAGEPVARAASPDGRWTYTAYAGGEEAFIHALDTEGRTAVCIDLEQFTPDEAYRLEIGAATGTIRVFERGDLAATVDPQTFEVAPVTDEPASVAGDEGVAATPYALAAAAFVVLAAGAILLVRRRRRATEEAGLGEVFSAAGTDGTAAEREAEPVP
jgi:hypothetical protein